MQAAYVRMQAAYRRMHCSLHYARLHSALQAAYERMQASVNPT